jgi:uncharacterized protein YpiB (UPF0302 family)
MKRLIIKTNKALLAPIDRVAYELSHRRRLVERMKAMKAFHKFRFNHAQELYIIVKALADILIPQECGLSDQDKLAIGQGICNPLMRKIRADLQRNIEEDLRA